MQLVVFAHRGEAQVSINELRVEAIPNFPNLYRSEKMLILISGEGIQNATAATAAAISRYYLEIDSVVNYGIAGALKKSLKKNDIYTIRTAYAEQRSKQVEFKSYTSLSDSDSKFDCISSVDRILDDEQSVYLSNFADIVDRELWGIAFACQQLNKPFLAYKLISDYAGSSTSCFDIKHNAAQFSQQFYDHLKKSKTQSLSNEVVIFQLPEGFYSTISQQRTIKSLIEKVALKERLSLSEILKKSDVEELQKIKISPKKRTAKLIQNLTDLLNPFNRKFNNQLNRVIKPLTEVGLNIALDEHLEKVEIRFQGKFVNQKQIDQLSKALREFNFDQFKDLLNGLRDV